MQKMLIMQFAFSFRPVPTQILLGVPTLPPSLPGGGGTVGWMEKKLLAGPLPKGVGGGAVQPAARLVLLGTQTGKHVPTQWD